ncbi:MAG: ABC transporter permease [Cytophagales bacterium]|nr:ABC transporter permease [Cytophagales bacterium]
MFKSYLTVAVRNLLRYKFYSAINVLGLTIGITCCLLISFYIYNELTYDGFHRQADRIYRVNVSFLFGEGQASRMAVTPPPLAAEMVRAFPEVAGATRLFRPGEFVARYGNTIHNEKDVFFADSSFFDVFTFPLLEGNAANALREPHTVVLTEPVARKYFGDQPARGKVLIINNTAHTVTGVARKPPVNSHFHFDLLISMSSYEGSREPEWGYNDFYTYVVLRDPAGAKAVEARLPAMIRLHLGPGFEKTMGYSMETLQKNGGHWRYFLQPLGSIHLHSRLDEELAPNGSIQSVYILAGIAFLIILIACINFINLSTARSGLRAREVGIRKVLGSSRGSLVGQFLVEASLYVLLSTLLAVTAAQLLLRPFNALSGKALNISLLGQWPVLAGMAGLILLIGIVAGSYPAFYLTAFQPIQVLKGKPMAGKKSTPLRSALVIFQFTISIALMICSWLVFRQVNHIRRQDLGFDQENVVVIDNARRLGPSLEAFRQALSRHAQVIGASISSSVPPGRAIDLGVFRKENTRQDHSFYWFRADYDFVPTLSMKLTEGRNFSRDFPSDSAGVLLNEAAASALGWNEAVGKKLLFSHGNHSFQVLGVVRSFNFESLRNQIKPCLILLGTQGNQISVRLRGGDVRQALRTLEGEWKRFAPDAPFQYSFLDDDFNALFHAEERVGNVFRVFTFLSILIACLGLLALVAYTIEQRTQEISIRKVMGASPLSLVLLITRQFTRLVILAFGVATPLSYYLVNEWLTGFAYRIEIGADVFVAAGLGSLLIAWLTVGYQVCKAAWADPVKSLKHE